MHGRRTDRRAGGGGAERARAHKERPAKEGAHGKDQVPAQGQGQGVVSAEEEAFSAQTTLADAQALA